MYFEMSADIGITVIDLAKVARFNFDENKQRILIRIDGETQAYDFKDLEVYREAAKKMRDSIARMQIAKFP